MSTELTGQVALITGSTRGIGKAIAAALGKAGAVVIITGRRTEDAEAVAQEFLAKGIAAEAIGADLSAEGAEQELMDAALQKCGKLDILVNNAGISPVVAPADRLMPDEWDRIIRVNLSVPFRLAQLVARHLIERGAKGSIINLASIGGQVALPGQSAYCASKAGLIAMTKVMAVDWARYGIRVNALAPGYVETDLTSGLRARDRHMNYILDHTPLGRLATPEEIAPAALFLASEHSSYMIGGVLTLDGGWLAV